jgi:hypothetical protein
LDDDLLNFVSLVGLLPDRPVDSSRGVLENHAGQHTGGVLTLLFQIRFGVVMQILERFCGNAVREGDRGRARQGSEAADAGALSSDRNSNLRAG